MTADSRIAAVLVAGLTIHVVSSAARRWVKGGALRLPRRLGFLFPSLLFVLAATVCYQEGVFTRALLSPVWIGAGIVAGHLIFGVSLLVICRSFSSAREIFFDFGAIWNFGVDSPLVLSRFIGGSISEEIIWRAAAQAILISVVGAPLGIAMIVLGFWAVHPHFLRNSISVTVEFIGFSLLLGVLYYWTSSLILVIVIHAIRNIEIAYLSIW